MKKFTEIIKENESVREYQWTATIEISGKVTASSEGNAGEMIDKEIDQIEGMVSYQINTINEIKPDAE